MTLERVDGIKKMKHIRGRIRPAHNSEHYFCFLGKIIKTEAARFLTVPLESSRLSHPHPEDRQTLLTDKYGRKAAPYGHIENFQHVVYPINSSSSIKIERKFSRGWKVLESSSISTGSLGFMYAHRENRRRVVYTSYFKNITCPSCFAQRWRYFISESCLWDMRSSREEEVVRSEAIVRKLELADPVRKKNNKNCSASNEI